ncbi:hypothetical protein [Nodosilinea nodulosa]|uniref:hypothetical protein n=1 Tax=Nodosilinea nodulosa TaxID=416001 RepID=UPI00031FF1AA|nr:hypothetical protein [Nodosilinea nodulosa]
MTVQDLLREATQLSLKEQIQLATQLLKLVDQQLEDSLVPESEATNLDNEEGSISYLLTHPVPVSSFQPLSRDQIYDRC